MRKILSILFLCLVVGVVAGQDNMQVQFGYTGTITGARYLPSTHNLDSSKFDINLSYSLWAANSSLTYSSMQTIITNNRISNEDINKMIGEMDDENKVSFGQDFLILGLGYRHNLLGKSLVWSFSISDRFLGNTIYPKELIQLIWQGNKQFEGESVDLSSTVVAGLYFREFVGGVNRNIIENETHKLWAAVRGKYLMGLSGLSAEQSTITFTTSNNADSLLLNYNIDYNLSGMSDFDLFQEKGRGFGIDLGMSYAYKDLLSFDVGLVDFGKIDFNKATSSFLNEASINFKGLNEYSLDNSTAYFDSISAILEPETGSGESFTVELGVKLSMMFSYKMRAANRFSSNRVFQLAYRQGFSEVAGTIRSPIVSLAFSNVMFNHFDVGLSSSYGGYKKYAVGGMLGWRTQHFKLGIYSDDFTGFVAPDKATGASLGVILYWRF